MGDYEEILSTLVDSGVDFIIAGGVACVLHGVERVTLDVDIAVALDRGNFTKFLDSMKRLGLQPRVPIDPLTLLDENVISSIIYEKNALVFSFLDPDRPTRHVDIFLRSDLNHNALSNHVELIEFQGKCLKVVSKEKLLSIKLGINPPRLKDLMDIEFGSCPV
jgi:hypothetical protein